jgi:hypothetical protein
LIEVIFAENVNSPPDSGNTTGVTLQSSNFGGVASNALALELHERVNPAITKDTSIFLIGITYSSSEIFIDQAKPRS